MKEKYTVKEHGNRLLKMMEMNDPCSLCPATPKFSCRESPYGSWFDDPEDEYYICHICSEFIGLNGNSSGICPCLTSLSEAEVWKATWIALEEKGFLEGGE